MLAWLTRLPLILAKLPELYRLVTSFLDILKGIAGDLFPTLSATQLESAVQTIIDPEYVKSIQSGMTSLGHDAGKVDGVYGQKTKDAVAAFQTKHGLTVDGWAGKVTQAKMNEELNKLPSVQPQP